MLISWHPDEVQEVTLSEVTEGLSVRTRMKVKRREAGVHACIRGSYFEYSPSLFNTLSLSALKEQSCSLTALYFYTGRIRNT